jgi:hypothetical protein
MVPGVSPLEQLQHLQQLLSGAWGTQKLHVAAELQIADLLPDGPREVEELAGSGQPGNLRGNAAAPVCTHAHAVRHGSPACRHRYGTSVFEPYQQHPERGAVFDEAMSSMRPFPTGGCGRWPG